MDPTLHVDPETLAVLVDLALRSERESRYVAVLAPKGAIAAVAPDAARLAIERNDPEAALDLLITEKAIAVRRDEYKYGRAGARKGRPVWRCVMYRAHAQKNLKIVWQKLQDIEGDYSTRDLAEKAARVWTSEGKHRFMPNLRHGTAWMPREVPAADVPADVPPAPVPK